MISFFVAQAENNVIGKANDLPWYLPADLRRFKELTTEHTVLMGRKTFESIVARLGKPLPNRTNVVVTRDETFSVPGVIVAHSIEEAMQKLPSDDESFVIGGAEIYRQALPFADRIYLTQVHASIDGDTFFPSLPDGEWKEISRERHKKDDKHPYDYDFVILDRV